MIPRFVSQDEFVMVLLRLSLDQISIKSTADVLLTANPKEEIAPAEVPMKKSNLSASGTPRLFSNL